LCINKQYFIHDEIDLTLPGGRDYRRKGINGRRLELQRQLEEENYIVVKWAQEDVETL